MDPRPGAPAVHVVVWNDAINLMNYVTWVFREVVGVAPDVAETLMRAVHEEGHAVVRSADRETCELLVADLHVFGLWATLERGD
jgi:ATP-dependent Clp protease adaptor protein ClpS